ncbi:hypothetical protein B0T10DRAFT_555540 [Thelonectria olida]|uniref:Uncharacterized protein n=1 Tax=Thelonectria olida TaxID=1576542 RepID=A0A9P9AVH1_9HYPO|nr:hypothetical protein B0T10DRAFT_555540 [Thelonectria olida]
MKVSSIATLLFAVGIIAMPWPPISPESASHRVITVNDDITVQFKVEKSADKSGADFSKLEACWMVCFSQQPKCPDGLRAKQFDECWTCCFGPENDL